MKTVPTLETDSLILRAMQLSDAPAIFAYASDPDVARLTHWKKHSSLNDTLQFISLNHATTLWAIFDKKTQTVIGECGFIHTTGTSTELHYALSRDYWGKGIAAQAATKIINFGFSALNITTINASIIEENVRSIRLAQKIGMREQLILPNYWLSESTLYNVHVYAITHQQV